MASDLVKVLDDFLIAENSDLAAERAIADDAWPGYLRERTPEPGIVSFGKRRAWQAAYAVASARPIRRETIMVLFLPVWWGRNRSEIDADDLWERVTFVVGLDGETQVQTRLVHDELVVAIVERTIRARIDGRGASSLRTRTLLTNDHFVVSEGANIERIREAYALSGGPPLPSPGRVVRAHSCDAGPAVDLDVLAPALLALPMARNGESYRTHGGSWWECLRRAIAGQVFWAGDLT